ncbi:UNVERIFIED_CONTAM: Methyl-CpG-binding domain-containing protein 9 [Sesamum indicum]
MEAQKKDESQTIDDVGRKQHLLLGRPISSELTPFLGDILQSWNFLWRFREVLGLSKGFSFEELTAELNGSLFDGLSDTHILMLHVLISEFLMKFENGSKRDVECTAMARRTEMNVPPLNDLTWPELARRYVLAILFMIADSESVEVREDMDMFRCLHGDGGPRCGALTGVVGLEADAWVLAAAINKIYGSLYDDNERLSVDDLDSDKETISWVKVNEQVPAWVRELEPIKMLKTNVGSKIRNCINNSLAKEPPEWARKILDNSISKEVYKANASGPTKKLALSVVAQFRSMQPNLAITKNRKNLFAISNIVMKQCGFVLREAALAKETKDFCTLIQERFVKHGNCEEGILGSPAMVSSLLNFRMIDMRLASGAYCLSHEAFAEEVQEVGMRVFTFSSPGSLASISSVDYLCIDFCVGLPLLVALTVRFLAFACGLPFWRNVLIVFENDSQVVDSAKKSCRVFESLYDKEVVALYQKLINDHRPECFDDTVNKDVGSTAVPTREISKGSLGEGFCKVCGIDENNKKVLLCDTCDAEYHTYCLRPPLTKVPKGNWFCSFCGSKDMVQDSHLSPTSSGHEQEKKAKREIMDFIRNEIADLAVAMRDKDYWELSFYEVVALYQKLINDHRPECFDDTVNKDVGSTAVPTREISKGSLGEGFCKVCGIDENNKKVLLCDTCDAEYHTYCLRPPLTKDMVQDSHLSPTSSGHEQEKKAKREIMDFIRNEIADLAVAMRDKDYWELSFYEKTSLLKFICDEILGTTLVRDHILKCESPSNLHTNSNSIELQAVRNKEDSTFPRISEDAPSAQTSEGAPAPSDMISVGLGTKTLKSSLRSEFLGIDSGGKLYWIIDSGTSPWILVNKVDGPQINKVTSQDFELLSEIFTLSGKSYSSWASYQSDTEIKILMDSLKDDEQIRRQLRNTFSQRRKVSKDFERQNQEELHPSLLERGKTRAAKLLEHKYGPFVMLEITDFAEKHNKGKSVAQDKMYRCDCLEPILPTNYHCLSCHRTCFSTMEFQLHGNGKCYLKKRESIFSLHGEGTSESVDGHDFSIEKKRITCSTAGAIAPNSLKGSEIEVEAQTRGNPGGLQHVDRVSLSHNVTQKLEIEKLCRAPEPSIRPLIGRAAAVLRQLKINLLDMEAAVPKVAFRSSKGCAERRRVWRMFVKRASNIYEMVQAVIVFEDMFKLEYIAYSWRKYWSFSAAANISTLAALALRVYSLDAAINYDETSSTSNTIKLSRKADKGKRLQNPNPTWRPSKKQKGTQK